MSWREDWGRLFPEAEYRPAMNLRALDARAFFQTQNQAALRERQRLLAEAPEFYRCRSEGESCLAEFLGIEETGMAEKIEPDWVILRQEAGNSLVTGGCVCFPTMWSLPEKLSLSLAAVHGSVPGLNAALEGKIDAFLARLPDRVGYGRENWGLSCSEKLDQHPRHGLREISATAKLAETWLRVEEQALVRLDGEWIVFGIRIQNVRLDDLPTGSVRARLAQALRTLPDEMAAYKRLTACRWNLAEKLAH